MSDDSRVTVIIVTFNSSQVITDCLASVPENVSVCIIDNASDDNTVQLAKDIRHDAQVIQNPENLGFGKAMNLGITQADTDFVLLLNPDARLEDGAIDTLLEKAEKYPGASILSPMVYHPNGEPQTTYHSNVFIREQWKEDRIPPEGDICVDMITGAVMLWRMSDMREIGYFDERFFFTYEDDDICMRVSQAGKSMIVTPEAGVVHDPGTSTPPSAALTIKKTRYVMTSRLKMEEKYRGKVAARKLAVRESIKYIIRTIVYFPLFYKKGVLRSYGRAYAACDYLAKSF